MRFSFATKTKTAIRKYIATLTSNKYHFLYVSNSSLYLYISYLHFFHLHHKCTSIHIRGNWNKKNTKKIALFFSFFFFCCQNSKQVTYKLTYIHMHVHLHIHYSWICTSFCKLCMPTLFLCRYVGLLYIL